MAHWFDKKLKKYVVSYYPNGRAGGEVRRVIPPEYQSEDGAAEYEKRLKEFRARNRPALPMASRKIGELAPEFYKFLQRQWSARYAEDTEAIFKRHVLRHLGRQRIDAMGPGEFELYKEARLREGGPNRAINKEIVAVRSFFKWCAAMKYCPPLNFRVQMLPYTAPKPRVLTVQDVIRICEAADLWHRCLYLCWYEAGMRKKEALGLKWQDIYWDQGAVLVHGKGNKERLVPLDGWLKESLSALQEARSATNGRPQGWDSESDYIFASKRTRRPITEYKTALAGAAKRAGIPRHLHAHLFRHSSATQMVANGSDIRKVQAFLGHSNITMTQRYTHMAVDMLRGDVLKLSTERKPKNVNAAIN